MRQSETSIGLLLALLAGTAACVGAPARRTPDLQVELPARWSAPAHDEAAADTAALGDTHDDWWTAFADPDLDTLVEAALTHNHDLGVAAARLAQAEALARIAGADLKPQFSAGLNASRRRQNFIGLPIPGNTGVLSTTSTNIGVAVNSSWEVDLWGRLRAQARAALAHLQATDAEYQGARLSLAGQTAKAWFAVAEAREQLDLAAGSAASFHRLAEQIRGRYERGVRPPIDLRLALSNQASADAQVEQRKQQLDRLTRLLEVLVGRYPAARLLERHTPRGLTPPPAQVPTGLPAELVSRRPDLVAAERRLAGADQRLFVARRQLYPRLSLTATGGTASDQLGDLLDGDFRVWSWLANLAQPIFQGGRLRAGVDQARGAVDESVERYAGAALRAYAEVENALAAETFLGAQEGHVAESATQLAAAERLATDRYRTGVGDYLTVLESQTRAYAARSNLIALRRARLDNRVDLHLALGGGFDATALLDPGEDAEDPEGATPPAPTNRQPEPQDDAS